MKKQTLLLFLTILCYPFLSAQSAISETEKLASLGKIYGFLKYYHPEVSKGKFDWDQELISQLPAVLKASDKASLSLIYINWIERLGELENCKKCDAKEEYFDKNFDLSWTQDTTFFSSELASKLKFIEENRNQGENFYVTTEAVGNVKLKNEPVYKDFDFPKEEYRLLGLFKYWNLIEYFFPYKYLTDQNWDAVLIEMIPKVRHASNKYEYQTALKELVAKLDDSHAWIVFDDLPQNRFLPVEISHIEDKAVVSSYYNDSIAELNNLRLGDVLLKVNGKDIQTELKAYFNLVSGSNDNYKKKKAYEKIFAGPEKSAELTLERSGEIISMQVNKYDFTDFDFLKNRRKIKSKSINEELGYINLIARYTPREFEDIFKSFRAKKAIIIDLRGYPQGSYKMFTRFTHPDKRVFAKKYNPDISYPGRYVFDDSPKTGGSKKAFNGKLIVLVSELSLSLSEFTAMAFQTANDVITVGSQTAGTDGRNIIIEYLGGYKTAFSAYGIMYPDGTASQRKGIKIDVEIKPSINGLREGRDEVLEKAIEIANN